MCLRKKINFFSRDLSEPGDIYRIRTDNIQNIAAKDLPITVGARSIRPGGTKDWVFGDKFLKTENLTGLEGTTAVRPFPGNYTSRFKHSSQILL